MKRKIHSYSSVRFTGTLNRLREIFFRRKLMLKAYHDKTISLLRKTNTLSFTLYFVAEKEADLICPGGGGGGRALPPGHFEVPSQAILCLWF